MAQDEGVRSAECSEPQICIAHLPLLPVAPVNSWRTPHSLSHGRAPASRRMRGKVGGERG
jgi:hypothetical protein